jgi:Flp pilus assembly protein TadD
VLQKLVDLLIQMQQFNDALKYANKLVELNASPTNRVLLGRAQILAGRKSAAILTFSELVDEHPKEGRAYYYLARARQRTGDFDGAVNAWRQSIRLLPAHTESRFNLANTLLKANRLAEVEKELEFLQEKHAEEANTWLVAGDLSSARGNFDEALGHFRRSKDLLLHAQNCHQSSWSAAAFRAARSSHCRARKLDS